MAEAGRATPISPDISICADCRQELFDPADRGYRYPFINCTNCGPRFTIVQDMRRLKRPTPTELSRGLRARTHRRRQKGPVGFRNAVLAPPDHCGREAAGLS